jgi:hypothetical protein
VRVSHELKAAKSSLSWRRTTRAKAESAAGACAEAQGSEGERATSPSTVAKRTRCTRGLERLGEGEPNESGDWGVSRVLVAQVRVVSRVPGVPETDQDTQAWYVHVVPARSGMSAHGGGRVAKAASMTGSMSGSVSPNDAALTAGRDLAAVPELCMRAVTGIAKGQNPGPPPA